MTQGEDLIALARSKAGQWIYTNDYPDRLEPEIYNGTDCSGFCRWCYQQFGYNIGSWTGDESKAGVEIARGHYPHDIPWDIMKPGDLILMTARYWNNYDFDQYLCHIELYCGDGRMIGHPGGWGPQEKWAQAWMESYGCITWMIRRVFGDDDDMRPSEVWEYNYANTAPGGNMYNALVNTTNAICTPHESAAGDETHGSMVDRIDYIDMRVGKMYDMLANGTPIEPQPIDYDKLADKVIDKLITRLAE